ncbi:TIGR02391 family protein [Bordetella hinzii]|uniref:TIGR02391 family protein n=1 Tax=Bordetella hinzii TaxID=103855 RepID=UPI00045A958C|nr:TIGR02391 family protein [Bordetella hinzii]KCB47978.1 TIGR02391 family protein [Bordetella hinzii 4161]VEH32026.1 HSP90 family protein [Bordetella hinzii]
MSKYELRFDPKTIEHLGVKMYATLPPALAELISNAYDADASKVIVEFFEQNGTPKAITIYDDGTGMSSEDIQKKFLVIGRNRRQDEGDKPSPKFKRLPTGKKGLGKLALFGLAKEVKVDTIKNNLRNRFTLNWDSLRAAQGVYNPQTDLVDQNVKRTSGTTIQLDDLKRKSPFDIEAIADSLSRIFIVHSAFQIILKDSKGKTVTITNDRRYGNVEEQFKWTEKDLIESNSDYYGKVELSFVTAKTPIPPSSGLRGIAIFSRGKLVNSPEYFSDSTSSHFYQYLTGWIKADFIDLLDEDVISTNRQSINWENPEMAAFREYLSALIARVGQDWRKRRAEKKDRQFKHDTGIDKEQWFNTLPTDVRQSVETIVKQMGDSEEVGETYAPVVKALYSLIPEYPLLHWRHLHECIKDGVAVYYKNEQFGHAADQGVKLYAEKLRKLSQRDVDGVGLADLFAVARDKKTIVKAPTVQINGLVTESDINMQEGQQYLTRGLITGFRNPVNHSPMATVVPSVISELDCLNMLSLISYLATRLDSATVNEGAAKRDCEPAKQ